MTQTHQHVHAHRLALRVREIGQLFNSMDPTPFLNKDLDPAANTFIESWASVYPSNSHFHITIHLEQWPQEGDPTVMLAEAVHNHFSYKAEQARKSLKLLLSQGRMSFFIGIVFVSLCLLGANEIARLGENEGYKIATESLTIVGWVAMWRPMQTFLYDWWPLQRQIRLYQRLAHAHIQAIQGK